jgi:hypothetical protein
VLYLNTTGQEKYAHGILAMIGTCLLVQLLTAWINTHKGPKRYMYTELAIVISGLYPAVAAHRVASGKEQAPYAVIAPMVELTFSRFTDLVFESIPVRSHPNQG